MSQIESRTLCLNENTIQIYFNSTFVSATTVFRRLSWINGLLFDVAPSSCIAYSCALVLRLHSSGVHYLLFHNFLIQKTENAENTGKI